MKQRTPYERMMQKARVDESTDRGDGLGPCWLFMGARNERGYGNVRVGIRMGKAHQVSFVHHRGEIPRGMVVRHKCDVRNCVNPAHLETGTQADNIMDTCLRGRWANQYARGAFYTSIKDAMACCPAWNP